MNGIYEDRFKTKQDAIEEVIRLEDIITEGNGESASAKIMQLRAQRNNYRIRWERARHLLERFLEFMEACGHHPDSSSERDSLRDQARNIKSFLDQAQEHTLPGDDKVALLREVSVTEPTNTVETAKRGRDSSEVILQHHGANAPSSYRAGARMVVLMPRHPSHSSSTAEPVPFTAEITSINCKENAAGTPTRIYLAVDLKSTGAPAVDMTVAEIEKALGKRIRIVKEGADDKKA
jgi:hypothetical protein